MKLNFRLLTTVLALSIVLTASGLILTGCDALKKETKQEISPTPTPPMEEEGVVRVNSDQEYIPTEEDLINLDVPQDNTTRLDLETDPADTIDQALKNLDTLPTEAPVNEQ